jgi:hypothetical protein
MVGRRSQSLACPTLRLAEGVGTAPSRIAAKMTAMSETEGHFNLGSGWPPWKEEPNKKPNEEPQRRPDPIRLAVMMLMGALLGRFLYTTPVVFNRLDAWIRWGPFVYIASGAMFGLAAELYRRSNEASWRRITLAVVLTLGTLILISAALSVANRP